jgi:hypothetical protein
VRRSSGANISMKSNYFEIERTIAALECVAVDEGLLFPRHLGCLRHVEILPSDSIPDFGKRYVSSCFALPFLHSHVSRAHAARCRGDEAPRCGRAILKLSDLFEGPESRISVTSRLAFKNFKRNAVA